jgi:hypothetical protein
METLAGTPMKAGYLYLFSGPKQDLAKRLAVHPKVDKPAVIMDRYHVSMTRV